MKSNSYSGESLEKALQEDVLTQSQVVLTGMVKLSEKSGYVGFTMSGCDAWVDLPTSMIEQAGPYWPDSLSRPLPLSDEGYPERAKRL